MNLGLRLIFLFCIIRDCGETVSIKLFQMYISIVTGIHSAWRTWHFVLSRMRSLFSVLYCILHQKLFSHQLVTSNCVVSTFKSSFCILRAYKISKWWVCCWCYAIWKQKYFIDNKSLIPSWMWTESVCFISCDGDVIILTLPVMVDIL